MSATSPNWVCPECMELGHRMRLTGSAQGPLHESSAWSTYACVSVRGLITIKNSELAIDIAPLNQIKVISYKDKTNWILETKYNIGKKKTPEPQN